jgi:RNA polymerase sigma-70 factor (ECF subfamily)
MAYSSDRDWAVAIAAADEEALQLFDRTFRGKVEVLAKQRHIGHEDAKDVAQDALADAVRQIRQAHFRGDSSLATWVYRIGCGKIADWWRAHNTRLVPLPSSRAAKETGLVESSAENVALVRQALERMRAADRLVLLLHDREGYTLEEIGGLFGLRKTAVGDRLTRARERFRQAVLHGGNPPDQTRLKD